MTAPPITAIPREVRAAIVEWARPVTLSDADIATLASPDQNVSPRVYPLAVIDGAVRVIGEGGTPRVLHNGEPFPLDEYFRELATLPATHPVGHVLRTTTGLIK